jgi:hypothetical protein
MPRHAAPLGLLLSVPLALSVAGAQAPAGREPETTAAPIARAGIVPIRPARDPNQPIDSAYTKKILEYTTEKFFLSPLVDYMPASRTVPTPMAVLGDIAGARNNLPYWK